MEQDIFIRKEALRCKRGSCNLLFQILPNDNVYEALPMVQIHSLHVSPFTSSFFQFQW